MIAKRLEQITNSSPVVAACTVASGFRKFIRGYVVEQTFTTVNNLPLIFQSYTPKSWSKPDDGGSYVADDEKPAPTFGERMETVGVSLGLMQDITTSGIALAHVAGYDLINAQAAYVCAALWGAKICTNAASVLAQGVYNMTRPRQKDDFFDKRSSE